MKEFTFSDRQAMADAAQQATSYLRAIANPSRLLLLCELLEQERNVGELEGALDMGQAYVSQQLARLRAEGMVRGRREGRVVYYSLADERVAPIVELLCQQFGASRSAA